MCHPFSNFSILFEMDILSNSVHIKNVDGIIRTFESGWNSKIWSSLQKMNASWLFIWQLDGIVIDWIYLKLKALLSIDINCEFSEKLTDLKLLHLFIAYEYIYLIDEGIFINIKLLRA